MTQYYSSRAQDHAAKERLRKGKRDKNKIPQDYSHTLTKNTKHPNLTNENHWCSMCDCHWCRVRWFTPIEKKSSSNSCVILTSGSLGIQHLYFYLISSFQNVMKMWPATSTRCTTARKDKTIWDLSLLQCSNGPSSKKQISSFRGCSCNILGKNKSLSHLPRRKQNDGRHYGLTPCPWHNIWPSLFSFSRVVFDNYCATRQKFAMGVVSAESGTVSQCLSQAVKQDLEWSSSMQLLMDRKPQCTKQATDKGLEESRSSADKSIRD